MSDVHDEPAFPIHDFSQFQYAGLSMRDYFAAKAMQGMVASQYDVAMRGYEGWREEFAREAYRYADAMIAARNGGH